MKIRLICLSLSLIILAISAFTAISANDSTVPSEIILPDSAAAFLAFDGYQVRESEYNGLRAMFSVNLIQMPTIEKDGYEVIEYGTLMASYELLTKNGDVLTYEIGENGDYETVSYGWQKAIWKKDTGICGSLIKNSEDSIEYACTVTNFTISNFEKKLYSRGYAIIADYEGNEYVLYSDYPNEEYRIVNIGQVCDRLFQNGSISEDSKSYSDIVGFRKQLKEDEAWSPTWKP